MKSRCVLACLSAMILFAMSAAANAADAPRPNIVIILVDDMGVMDTSVPFLTDESGHPKRYPLNDYYRTPNMERLAARGIRFNQFCAMSVCSPTRISIMTGQNAARHATTTWINPTQNNRGPNGPPDWRWEGLKQGQTTLAGMLKADGYQTMHVGKGHFGPTGTDGADPTKLGFDINIGGTSIGAPGSYFAKQNFGNNNPKRPNGVPHLQKYHGTDLFLTEALTLETKMLLTNAVKAQKPFFLNFAHYAVHAPFNLDPRFADHYKDSGKPAPAQAFAALVEGMDKSLGDILDHLDALGVAENTLIFFLGDNGSDAPLGHEHAVACAAPLRGKKGSHYEGGMRIPFIASWAKRNDANPHQKRLAIPAGAIQTQLASVQDLFPTVLDIAGVSTKPPVGHEVDGWNLKSLLAGDYDKNRSKRFLMHFPHSPHRSVYWSSLREGDWKVIYHYFPSEASENGHYQLFNLKADPFEQKNLVASEPAELKRMMQGLIAELERREALYPVDKDGKTQMKPKLP